MSNPNRTRGQDICWYPIGSNLRKRTRSYAARMPEPEHHPLKSKFLTYRNAVVQLPDAASAAIPRPPASAILPREIGRSIGHGHSRSLTGALPDVGKAGARAVRLIRGEYKLLQFRPWVPESPSRRRHDGPVIGDGAANTCFGFLRDRRG